MKPIMYSLLIGTAGWVLSLSLAFSTNDFYHTLVSNIAFLLIVTPVIVGVRIAIARFNLMTLTPQRKAAELISGITQPVFMVDVKGKVIFQNQAAAKLAGISGVGSSYRLFELFLGSDRIRAELENIAEKKNYTESLRLSLREHKLKHATYLLKLQGIKNEADDYIGAICTAEKENSFNGFRNRYGISPRELDVLFLSITVYTNVEIARELGISKRTVEHHHENIYNKLGVNNKLELYNVSAKYGLSVNGAPAEVE